MDKLLKNFSSTNEIDDNNTYCPNFNRLFISWRFKLVVNSVKVFEF